MRARNPSLREGLTHALPPRFRNSDLRKIPIQHLRHGLYLKYGLTEHASDGRNRKTSYRLCGEKRRV